MRPLLPSLRQFVEDHVNSQCADECDQPYELQRGFSRVSKDRRASDDDQHSCQDSNVRIAEIPLTHVNLPSDNSFRPTITHEDVDESYRGANRTAQIAAGQRPSLDIPQRPSSQQTAESHGNAAENHPGTDRSCGALQ